jgi:hypothetical protein
LHSEERRVLRLEMSSNPVEGCGEELSEVWWQGRQWAVTAYGIECRDGLYYIEKSRLLENQGYSWPRHMADNCRCQGSSRAAAPPNVITRSRRPILNIGRDISQLRA